MDNGIFITVEGIDGSGKSTQIEMMLRYLSSLGWSVCITREPGGTEISERIREILLDRASKEMEALTELFLFLASRAQHTREVIIPNLRDGKAVLSDRYADSSVAFQGYGRSLGWELVDSLNKIATFGLVPDLTILLDIPPEIAQSRLESVQGKLFKDRLEGEKLEFHRIVREGYIAHASRFPERIKVIDAMLPVESVWNEIKKHLDEVLKRKRRR
jgi:dTMP kinase